MNLRDYASVNARQKALEDDLKVELFHIGNYSISEKQASSKNCENMIGATQIPLGIAGPLKVRSFDPSISLRAQDKSSKFNPSTKLRTRVQSYYIPLATTEGALVASVNRGCKAITESGGASVISKKIGITRAPVFVVDNLISGKKFVDWIASHFKNLKSVTESTSTHLTLLEIKPTILGRNVFLRFCFDSEDAMGMNMATIAVAKAIEFIEAKTKASCVAISSNMCVDKKPNFLNFILGRGFSVWAESTIPSEVVERVLKTEIEKIVEVAHRKLVYGSMLSGSIGMNAHFANILSALFIATGQDVAHVAECSMGVTTVEKIKDKLYISIYLPDLVVGTVGGGTELETQKEALSIMGISGGNNGKNSQKFSEIIGGAVLAGELSLLASLAEGSLTVAHQSLGRGVSNKK